MARFVLAGERGRSPLFSEMVEPGEYRLESHQRPCDGNCSLLDPPVDGCEVPVRVDGAPVRATIVLAQAGGCEIRVARGA